MKKTFLLMCALIVFSAPSACKPEDDIEITQSGCKPPTMKQAECNAQCSEPCVLVKEGYLDYPEENEYEIAGERKSYTTMNVQADCYICEAGLVVDDDVIEEIIGSPVEPDEDELVYLCPPPSDTKAACAERCEDGLCEATGVVLGNGEECYQCFPLKKPEPHHISIPPPIETETRCTHGVYNTKPECQSACSSDCILIDTESNGGIYQCWYCQDETEEEEWDGGCGEGWKECHQRGTLGLFHCVREGEPCP